jgi:ubiquinone biosynthesis protein UbiJ
VDDLKEIVPSAVSGGLGATIVGWLMKSYIQDKLDTINRHTAEIADIKAKMVTRQDLDDTAENLQEAITRGTDSVTARIDTLFAKMAK